MALMALVMVLSPRTAAEAAGATSRVSVSSAGDQGDNDSFFSSISADGRFVAFSSYSSNLAPGDEPENCVLNYEFISCPDVFVHDRQTGATEMISVTPGGVTGYSPSDGGSISGDGRFVAFDSESATLVAGDTNLCDPPGGSQSDLCSDVFVRDRQTGTTERVSVSSAEGQSDGPSYNGSISADGRFVVFESMASNLVAGDTNTCQLDGDPEPESCPDIFVRDRQSGTTERVSVSSGGVEGNTISTGPSISGDGRFVSFTYFGSNMVAGDTNGVPDGFVRDRQSGTTERVTVSNDEAEANGYSQAGDLSSDGRFVAVWSQATNLVPGDSNGLQDAFVRDRLTGTTALVSVDSGEVQGNGLSSPGPISANGRLLAFFSEASNLVAGDTNGVADAFLRDLQTGETERVSVGTGGVQGNSFGAATGISADGRFISFWSVASNLVAGDTNGHADIFVHDRAGADTDGDGVPDGSDNCPATSNAGQTDTDADGDGDACDNCPSMANPDQRNTDGDAQGDACDPDDDNDGALDGADNCPLTPSVDQTDSDGDMAGDPCDAAGGGNVDCSNSVNGIDALKVLRHSASLSVSQSEPCLDIGLPRLLAPPDNWKMGDVDCSGSVNSIDALKVLRAVAGLSVALSAGCPEIKPP
jgi:Tol biopolymer transport system component